MNAADLFGRYTEWLRKSVPHAFSNLNLGRNEDRHFLCAAGKEMIPWFGAPETTFFNALYQSFAKGHARR
jgi:hypothetical protein